MRIASFSSMALAVLGTSLVVPGACLVKEHCYGDQDCAKSQVCLTDGVCGYECELDQQCGSGMGCVEHRCKPKASVPFSCPADMVNVADAFCVDRYEASRPDASEANAGVDESRATSRKGVFPWQVSGNDGNAKARKACLAAGKDLCTPQQWRAACRGPADTDYGYGDVYEAKTCNGIDLFGREGFHLLPTGALTKCQSGWGAFDMNGNLWEHTLLGDNKTIRGGAFNCLDSQLYHRCDYVPGSWEPSARGFRCCYVPGAVDGGSPDVASDVGVADTTNGSQGSSERGL